MLRNCLNVERTMFSGLPATFARTAPGSLRRRCAPDSGDVEDLQQRSKAFHLVPSRTTEYGDGSLGGGWPPVDAAGDRVRPSYFRIAVAETAYRANSFRGDLTTLAGWRIAHGACLISRR